MEVEQRRIAGEAELQGCATVAQVYIEKADVIQREEISKISSNLNECGMCNINVDDPAFLKSGISDFMAEIDNSLSLCF
ncbi:rho guanine nucleotide exchange factor 19 [Corchorus olitorius]|uniref:Rho guanine nucleotide exchange factor 19 n=1 Tax=Corchorus olitorius TaxID=93759 RepID=A0A1R3L4R5_9ROSI|nr:rho guanine nucleotide exchange factor 19 [Corchorus olitorius]